MEMASEKVNTKEERESISAPPAFVGAQPRLPDVLVRQGMGHMSSRRCGSRYES